LSYVPAFANLSNGFDFRKSVDPAAGFSTKPEV